VHYIQCATLYEKKSWMLALKRAVRDFFIEEKFKQYSNYDILMQMLSIYTTKLLEIEQHYSFDQFYGPCLKESDFIHKPMILCLGPYSVGKTSFIKFGHSMILISAIL